MKNNNTKNSSIKKIFINYNGIGNSSATGGIETYYKNVITKETASLFLTKDNVNKFDNSHFQTKLYLSFIRRKIKNPFLRSHFDWYFQLYYKLKILKKESLLQNENLYIEIPDSFGYGIIPYLLNIPYEVKIHTPHSVVVELNSWHKTFLIFVIKQIEKKAIQKATKITSPSKAMIDYLLKHHWHFNKKKCYVVQNKFYSTNKTLNLQKQKTILFVGNLEPRKNLIFVLDSYLKSSKMQNYKLVICGKDSFVNDKKNNFSSYWNYCCKQFPKIKENQNIEYKGFIPNSEIAKFYQTSSIFILPSTGFENFPTVILEAFANETIVIASNVGGIPEMIEDEKNGLIFTDNSFDSLEKCFEKIETLDKIQLIKNAKKTLEKINAHVEEKYYGTCR